MDRLKTMKEQLTSCVEGQLTDLKSADAKELGEAVDMIKDLAEAIYYCKITEAMEETEKEGKKQQQQQPMYYPQPMYYTQPLPYPEMEREDYDRGWMYYGGRRMNPAYYGGNSGGNSMGGGSNASSGGNNARGGGSRGYSEYMPEYRQYEMMRDPREGRSPQSRRMYMESQEMHKDQAKKMQELEKYMQELTTDITEMIAEATPEEKQMLQQKIATLSTKIK